MRALSSLALSALMLCKSSSENGDGLDLQARKCEKTVGRELMLKSSKAPGCFLRKISNLNFGLWDFPLLYTLASDVTKQANPSNSGGVSLSSSAVRTCACLAQLNVSSGGWKYVLFTLDPQRPGIQQTPSPQRAAAGTTVVGDFRLLVHLEVINDMSHRYLPQMLVPALTGIEDLQGSISNDLNGKNEQIYFKNGSYAKNVFFKGLEQNHSYLTKGRCN
ncbi:Jouberin [Manis pentadactyla]|nr:Jouberin [Manis pentadactyla]